MRVKALHVNFKLPKKGTSGAGAFDLFMPEGGYIPADREVKVGLGFAAAVPPGHVALVVPRSGVGSKIGLELNNTVAVIDADYRGEWFATLRTKNGHAHQWLPGERLLQFMVVPVKDEILHLVHDLDATERGEGGLGSTGR